MLCKITATLFKNGINSVAGKATDFLLEVVNGRNENVRRAMTGNFTLPRSPQLDYESKIHWLFNAVWLSI